MGLVDKVEKAKKAVSLEKSERENFLSEVRHLAEQRLREVAGEEDFTLSSRIYTGISGYHYDYESRRIFEVKKEGGRSSISLLYRTSKDGYSKEGVEFTLVDGIFSETPASQPGEGSGSIFYKSLEDVEVEDLRLLLSDNLPEEIVEALVKGKGISLADYFPNGKRKFMLSIEFINGRTMELIREEEEVDKLMKELEFMHDLLMLKVEEDISINRRSVTSIRKKLVRF